MGKRKRNAKLKNKPRRRRRQQQHTVEQSSCFDKMLSCPIPALCLTNDQWKKLEPCSKLVELDEVVKESGMYIPKWEIIWTGENFSESEIGAIVAEKSSIKKCAAYNSQNIRYVGTGRGSTVLLAVWNNTKKDYTTYFDSELMDEIAKTKPENIKDQGESHHGTWGAHYGYGCKASFDKVSRKKNLNSVEAYATLPPSECRGSKGEIQARGQKHKKLVAKAVQEGSDGIDMIMCGGVRGPSLVGTSTVMTRSIVDVTKAAEGDIEENLSPLPGSDFPAAFINQHHQTDRFHTEEDSSLTLICVPPQASFSENDPKGSLSDNDPIQAQFEFRLGAESIIKVDMGVGMSILFSGFFLVHRQQRTENASGKMVNVSAYGNKRFFANCRTTHMRLRDRNSRVIKSS